MEPKKKLALLHSISRYGGSIDDRLSAFGRDCKPAKPFYHLQESFFIFSIDFLYHLTTVTSDYTLTFVTVVLSAVFGAAASRIREDQGFDARILFLGAVAGFLSCLLFQGGFVSLTGSHGVDATNINPHAAALLGAMSGLFTSKFFFALNAITDSVLSRITKSFN